MAAAMNRLTFRATMAKVSVPATSANLGPGFDCFGLALDIRDQYAAQILDDPGFDIDVTGEGAADIPKDGKNLVIKAMMAGFSFMGSKPRGIALRALNEIPQGRGLGSSASAIVGGLALSRALVLSGDEYMSDEDLLALGTELEGHPDNVAAALYGGVTIAWMENMLGKDFAKAVAMQVHPSIKAILLLPENHLATSKARKLLPAEISHKDAASNSARTALLVQALTARPDLIFTATQDYLHQKYRTAGMPKSLALMDSLRNAGFAAVISGAGPAVLVLHASDQDPLPEIADLAGASFKALPIGISTSGVL